MKKLYELINELSMLFANHVICMNNLRKAIREGEPFEHKDCHACNFGKMWDEEVASKIDAQNQKPEDKKAIEQAESISTELVQKLTELKIMSKVRQAM
ncbi:hypothetical protein Hydth_1447 [Hydrogenobacter thermophilus TK-6]|uniref:Chemoreceptor zinc-binding domain-containing protein n=1 Tax=Hydrogenobacter thermophilus (strain DSM 6534 / IAM 12695 / TK-6) TaxID=608538 RepID=D3DJA7_HYDTT|nr:CZB domain-containing protein [Hydrogenobacter thermophilus]ADO45832.1 hypothetical protein Hydth_1447 [Hydrogenobacter thermophilus TK-6]BAI69909.1 hypothetical protein HTH_1459 [Hydrogenobacter thermophilus TK-6]